MVTDKEKAEMIAGGLTPERANEIASQAQRGTEAIAAATGTIQDSFTALQEVEDWAGRAGKKLEELGDLSGKSAVEFGLLSTVIAGTKVRFQEFLDLDKGGAIGTFGQSFTNLFQTISAKGSAIAGTTAAGKKLLDMLAAMAVPSSKLRELMAGTSKDLVEFAKNLVTSADNGLRFENGIIRAAVAGGDLEDEMANASGRLVSMGTGFENVNKSVEAYYNVLGRAMEATGVENADLMAKFLLELKQTPGAVEAMSKGMTLAGEDVDTLTAVVRLAHGANLDLGQSIHDVTDLSVKYGIDINKTSSILVRYSDISKTLKARQEDVREVLNKTLGSYEMYSRGALNAEKVTQGVSDSINNWAKALEAAGVPARKALELAGQYTDSLKDLDEAQESLIMQETGGPGGLAGIFEFEDLMETDPKEANRRAVETLKNKLRQMGGTGEILSKEQAKAMGEAGETQYMNQQMLIRSGILGFKPKSKEEARALSDTLAKGGDIFAATTAGAGMEAATAGLAERGRKEEGLARTEIKEANIAAERVRLQGEIINLETVQRMGTATTGGGGESGGRGLNTEAQAKFKTMVSAGSVGGGGPGTGEAFSALGRFTESAPDIFSSMFESIKRQLSEGQPIEEVLRESGLFNATMGPPSSCITVPPEYAEERRLLMSGQLGVTARTPEEADAMIAAIQRSGGGAAGGAGGSGGATGGPGVIPGIGGGAGGTGGARGGPGVIPGIGGTRAGGAATSTIIRGIGAPTTGAQVGRVIPGLRTGDTGTAAAGTRTGTGVIGGLGTPTTQGGPVPVTVAGGSITVNLTGACPHCGRDVHQSQQTGIQSQASQSSNRGT